MEASSSNQKLTHSKDQVWLLAGCERGVSSKTAPYPVFGRTRTGSEKGTGAQRMMGSKEGSRNTPHGEISQSCESLNTEFSPLGSQSFCDDLCHFTKGLHSPPYSRLETGRARGICKDFRGIHSELNKQKSANLWIPRHYDRQPWMVWGAGAHTPRIKGMEPYQTPAEDKRSRSMRAQVPLGLQTCVLES
ncbi:hypothetical protein RRG08_000508 [Elysia crispata]|uniref:Uncharacterized protein n=1 Tax=Elysia crispata TaxID=231223 RepID=A0AAE0YC43_9GAST|nr:hypothetical protein RRG08_000508 [Elysia crispata]